MNAMGPGRLVPAAYDSLEMRPFMESSIVHASSPSSFRTAFTPATMFCNFFLAAQRAV
jgi:hypothetical protein